MKFVLWFCFLYILVPFLRVQNKSINQIESSLTDADAAATDAAGKIDR